MEQSWGPQLVASVAREIRRHRDRRKLSAQALSNRCTELGWPIARSVISNLESGYRETVTIPELLVLAEALEVPPLLLLLPLGYADQLEVLPGRSVPTTDALRWLLGESSLPGGPEWDDAAQSTVPSMQVHHRDVSEWTWSRYYAGRIRSGEDQGSEQDAMGHDARAARAVQGLQSMRHLMRARGMQPPPLPPELAALVDGGRP